MWPENPKSLDDIPSDSTVQAFLKVERPSYNSVQLLCSFVARNNNYLDSISQGNDVEERALGTALLGAYYFDTEERSKILKLREFE